MNNKENEYLELITDLYLQADMSAEELKRRVSKQDFLLIGHKLVDRVEDTLNLMLASCTPEYQQYKNLLQ
jgi:hypothetical protein